MDGGQEYFPANGEINGIAIATTEENQEFQSSDYVASFTNQVNQRLTTMDGSPEYFAANDEMNRIIEENQEFESSGNYGKFSVKFVDAKVRNSLDEDLKNLNKIPFKSNYLNSYI